MVCIHRPFTSSEFFVSLTKQMSRNTGLTLARKSKGFISKEKNSQVCQMPKNTGLTFTRMSEGFISKEKKWPKCIKCLRTQG
jgi:hypothetical protein